MNTIELKTVEAFFECQYKAHMLSNGESGEKSTYELLMNELKEIYKHKFLTIAKKNHDSIKFDLQIYSGIFNLKLDAVELTKPPHLEGIQYIPYFVLPNEKVTLVQKLLAAFVCSLLNDEDNQLSTARIVYGKRQKTTNIALKHYFDNSKRLLKDLGKFINRKDEPTIHKIKHCQICEFKNLCLSKLRERDDLSLLGGMGKKQISKLNNKGIFTVNQLSYTYRPKRRKKKVVIPDRIVHSLKALALREKKTFVLDNPIFPDSEWDVYLDMEGLTGENFWYLIGLLGINQKTGERIERSFWADTQEDTKNILKQFSNTISALNNFTVFHYGSYEMQALKKINKQLNGDYDELLTTILKNNVNLLPFFTSSLYPPTYTNGLKDIASYIGFVWSDRCASGLQSIVWRQKWELTNDEQFKDKLIEYNRNDCEALYKVKEWIEGIGDINIISDDKHFANTSSLPSRNTHNKWGDPNFQSTDFKEINRFAYFDYQREKIYLRTNKYVKKALTRENKYRKNVYKVDKRLGYLPFDCPSCSNNEFYSLDRKKKLIINLKFMKNGVKKWNVQVPATSFQCSKCLEEFSINKYGRNLMIWSMNQYLSYLVSMPKIGNMILENFNIYVPEHVLYEFKPNLAKEYQSTYEEIRQTLIEGLLIHADETKIAVKENPDGYVWVFTSMDTVYYEYRPNRKAAFLKDLLKDFQGVLISDYFPGYDSLSCQQQKCLIHLIRDLNGDLLTNQLNTEYKNIVVSFGVLLRKIIKTVDTFGLRKIHLEKHKKEIDDFYNQLLTTNHETELAIHWQKRFRKNKGKLFNFLNYDGIPWNNNNAENAIKPLAKYRARSKGILRETGVKDFVVLLSVQQTCRYRGINFLDFLKSKEKNITKY